MVTHIDGSVYFFGLLFSTGLLYSGYRIFKNSYDDYRDNTIEGLSILVRKQNFKITELERELTLRRIVNNPEFLNALAKEFDDSTRTVPENGYETDVDEDVKPKQD